MFSSKKRFLLILCYFLDCALYAQQKPEDQIKKWRAQSLEYGLHADSFRIMATAVDEDKVVLQSRLFAINDSLNRVAGSDIKKNIHDDPRMTELDLQLKCLLGISTFLQERFGYRLQQIDSCLTQQRILNREIYDAEHRK